ncbi:hypothetical protein AGR3A_Lc130399 [Agrobacterium tomkonis CFBP 6623]|uniref:Uncharacterized protein n=1 Tax=Agrobacterium tomkonis CFBP 6623 TaxID=1183432 RepID=A0A1S7RFM9_9HYPH|nr:hypothetical protein AGR3A_Lc130399 [Agrobacterium tomkonis CFBP 6623]
MPTDQFSGPMSHHQSGTIITILRKTRPIWPPADVESSCPFPRKSVLSEPERSPTRWCGACS